MSVRSLALLAALGGCNRLWSLTEVGADAAIAPNVEAGTDLSDQCIPTFPNDTFDDQPACIGVGTPEGDADTLDFDSNSLVVGLPATGTHLGGCLSHEVVAFGAGGIFANVTQIATGSSDFNVFSLHWSDGVTSTGIFASPAGLSLAHVVAPATTGPSLGTTTTLAPWWRIRPSGDRSAILGESSMDGTHWVQFATDPVAAPAKGSLELAIGSFANDPDGNPQSARVASINVCP